MKEQTKGIFIGIGIGLVLLVIILILGFLNNGDSGIMLNSHCQEIINDTLIVYSQGLDEVSSNAINTTFQTSLDNCISYHCRNIDCENLEYTELYCKALIYDFDLPY